MSSLQLPYPEYSWSLSQHMRRSVHDERLIFALLQGAFLFGQFENYADRITQFVNEQGIIPPNIRENRSQIWRDYQQVLVELGLIVSTRYTNGQVIVTPIGLSWLDGLIGTKEMLTTQALGYQYPNGYKLNVPPVVRDNMRGSNNIDRVSLDSQHGILIKPAVLILRILLELYKNNEVVSLDSRECVKALLPIKKNSEWGFAYEELRNIRRENRDLFVDFRSLRHIQEWFALLGATDLIIENRNRISFSDNAVRNISEVEILCNFHEDLRNFWYPSSTNNIDAWARSWFSYFGSPALDSQWILPETSRTKEYVEQNYLEGYEDSESDEVPERELFRWDGRIEPQPFVPFIPQLNDFSERTLTQSEAARIIRGITRRQRSTRLHEHIVEIVATRLQERGYSVLEDRQSVDLLGIKDQKEVIIEVKTVNSLNIFPRMRLGIGQLSEYRYRREIQKGERPNGILVLSNSKTLPPWLINYLEDDVNLGLLCIERQEQFTAHTHGIVETSLCV